MDIDTQPPVFINKKAALKLNPKIIYDLTMLDSVEIEAFVHSIESLITNIRNIEKKFEYNKIPYSGSDVLKEIKEQNSGKTFASLSLELLVEI